MRGTSMNSIQLSRMRKFVISVALIVAISMLLTLFIPEVAYAKAKSIITIIQDRFDIKKPLKPFIYVGETIDFDVLLNGKAIEGTKTSYLTWKISDNSASVDKKGQVKGLGEGIVTVTVRYKNGKDAVSDKIHLQIKYKVKRVNILTGPKLKLQLWDSEQIYASYDLAPEDTGINDDICFSSSNNNIASVDKYGQVHANSPGTANIYATYINKDVLTNKNGSYKDKRVKAACTVVVSRVKRPNARKVSGLITDIDGKPLKDIKVRANVSEYEYYTTTTDKNGRYVLYVLTERFSVTFKDLTGQHFALYWKSDNEKGTLNSAQIRLDKGAEITDINAKMEKAGRIIGTIKDNKGYVLWDSSSRFNEMDMGLDINIHVYKYSETENKWIEKQSYEQPYNVEWNTDNHEEYVIGELEPGKYRLEFYDNPIPGNPGYLTSFWKKKKTLGSATDIVVHAGKTVVINPVMLWGGSVSGKLLNYKKIYKSDVPNEYYATPYKYNNKNKKWEAMPWEYWAKISDVGKYSVTGLDTGKYRILFTNARDEYIPKFSKTINVKQGKKVKEVNVSLQLGGKITGNVILPTEDTYIWRGNEVDIIPYKYNEEKNKYEKINKAYFRSEWSEMDSHGDFTLNGLTTGTYRLKFDTKKGASRDYETQWWSGQASVDTATDIKVEAGKEVTNINVTMVEKNS